MSYPPYQYEDLGDGKMPIVNDASYDSIRDVARRMGEVKVPDACIGCREYPYSCDCELCPYYSSPDPRYEIPRQIDRISEALKEILAADFIRYERGASIDSPAFQSQIKEPMSVLLDAHDRLMDATNSSTAKPEGE